MLIAIHHPPLQEEQEARRAAELQCLQFEQSSLFSNVSVYQEFFKTLEDLRFDTSNLFQVGRGWCWREWIRVG